MTGGTLTLVLVQQEEIASKLPATRTRYAIKKIPKRKKETVEQSRQRIVASDRSVCSRNERRRDLRGVGGGGGGGHGDRAISKGIRRVEEEEDDF